MKRTVVSGLMLIIGIVMLGAACPQNSNNGYSSMNMNGMMNSNSGMNMNGMDHNSMPMNSNMPGNYSEVKSNPNAASAPYDLQFIDAMTHHHQGAVEMSKVALTKSNNEELKKFAQKIIDDQQGEIAQMKEWREKWFSGKTAALNMEMPGMADSMKMMAAGGMKKMESATGKDFDLLFLEMMIPHHTGAITMAKASLTKAEHTEIKTLANNIIKAQEAEIKMMNEWKSKWLK